jgi:hypothetical protein
MESPDICLLEYIRQMRGIRPSYTSQDCQVVRWLQYLDAFRDRLMPLARAVAGGTFDILARGITILTAVSTADLI